MENPLNLTEKDILEAKELAFDLVTKHIAPLVEPGIPLAAIVTGYVINLLNEMVLARRISISEGKALLTAMMAVGLGAIDFEQHFVDSEGKADIVDGVDNAEPETPEEENPFI